MRPDCIPACGVHRRQGQRRSRDLVLEQQRPGTAVSMCARTVERGFRRARRTHHEPIARGLRAGGQVHPRGSHRVRWHGGCLGRPGPRCCSRDVAVKVMRPDIEHEKLFALRFRDEAVHSAGLLHANIATVFDYGEDDGLAYLVVELVDGQPLSAVLRERGPLPHGEVRSIMGQAALALSVAHKARVVHRDVKPANIMIRTRRAGEAHGLRDRPGPRRLRAHDARRAAGHPQLHEPRAGSRPGSHRRPATSTRWASSPTRCSAGDDPSTGRRRSRRPSATSRIPRHPCRRTCRRISPW